jgi:WD40 repeat protein
VIVGRYPGGTWNWHTQPLDIAVDERLSGFAEAPDRNLVAAVAESAGAVAARFDPTRRRAENRAVPFQGGCWALRVVGALAALVSLGAACTSHGAASVRGGAGGLAFDAGGDGPGAVIGDPDRSRDAAAGGGGNGGTAGSTAGGTPGTGGSAGDASGAGDGGLPAPAEIHACRLLGIGHTLSMDLSPDGKLAAYGSAEGGITLIGVADFVARRTITAHPGNVTAVAFSSDSTKIASADADGNVAMWKVADGSPVWSAAALDGRVEALALSASGPLWALTAGGLSAIDVATGTHGAAAAAVGAGAAAFAVSPDGHTIALGDTDGDVRLLDARDLSLTASIAAAHAGGVTALRISGDGRKLVTGGADGTTALWDLQGNLVARVSQPKQPATSVDVNSDGSLLSAGGVAPAVVMAFKPDGTPVASYGVFPSYTRLSFDGKYLVSMTGISRADRNSLDTTKLDARAWDDSYSAAAFSPDGRYVAESVYDNVRLWDTTTGEMVRVLDSTPPITSPATAIAFSPDGATLARNDYNHNLYVFRTADSALLAQYTGVTGSDSVVYSPDGQWLATPGVAHVLLWHVSDGSIGPTGFVGSGGSGPTAVAFAPDGRALAVGDRSGNVVLWSFPEGVALAQFAALARTVQRIAFSPDGTRLAVSDHDDPPKLFARDGTELPLWPEALTASFAFSFDGAYLATVVRGPSPTFPITVRKEENDVLLSVPSTGAAVAHHLWTTDIGFNQSDDSLLALVAFAPHDHRLLIATGLGAVICLP